MLCRSSGGDDADRVFPRLGEDNHGENALENANPDPSLLAIVLPLVEESDHGMLKHRGHIQEIHSVPPDIAIILRLIPFVGHRGSVYTNRSYVKWFSSTVRTLKLS